MSSNDDTTKNLQLIRKLGGSELLYDRDLKNCTFMNSRVFRIQTKIDIYSRIDLLKQALALWKSAHHFLRSTIVRDCEGRKWFAYAPDECANSNENVDFLYFQMTQARTHEDVWRLFLERELGRGLNSDRLLWRLIFLQVVEDKSTAVAGDEQQFEYYLVFSFNHAIMDGRNVIQTLNQLITFFENLYLNKPVDIKPYDVLPALDEHPEVIEHRQRHINESAAHPTPPHKDLFRIPDQMLVRKPYQPYTTFDTSQTDDVILTHDKAHVFATYAQLVDDNKLYNTRVQALVYEQDIFMRLLKKCKQHDTKLTGALNIIAIIAFQQTCKKFSELNKELSEIFFATTVSMRAHLRPPIDLYRMGYCSLLFETEFNGYIDKTDTDQFWSEKFWQYASVESRDIHARLDNRQYIDIVSVDDAVLSEFDFCEETATKEAKYNFVLSNRGDMTDLVTTENKLCKFTETFSGMAFGKDNQYQVFMHLIESINKTLFWSMTSNKNILNDESVKFHFDFIDNAIRKLIAA